MNLMLAEWFDSASLRLREVLGELEGVSPETLERIDHISRATKDGPAPHDPAATLVYERLVLLALSQSALARQQAGATKAKKAS
jgi:hypothetical protein